MSQEAASEAGHAATVETSDHGRSTGWLREEQDAYGVELPHRRQRLARRHFRGAVAFEVAFFDQAYEKSDKG